MPRSLVRAPSCQPRHRAWTSARVSCDAAAVAPRSHFQLTRQLTLQFEPRSTSTTSVSAAPSAPTAAPVSRTKLLVDAVVAAQPGARVVITDNRTVLLSQATKDGVRVVRAHQMFLDAPAEVRLALGHYLAHGDRKSGKVVDGFVDAQSHLLELAARPLKDGAHRGDVHDLLPMFVDINAAYFKDGVDAEIGWSQAGKPTRRRRRSITFGSYDARAKRIVIHPVLDQPDVPVMAVARVVHHEMLHQIHEHEPRDRAGRRVVHSPRFRADEAKFHGAKEADAWFDKNLDALLRWRPGQARGRP